MSSKFRLFGGGHQGRLRKRSAAIHVVYDEIAKPNCADGRSQKAIGEETRRFENSSAVAADQASRLSDFV